MCTDCFTHNMSCDEDILSIHPPPFCRWKSGPPYVCAVARSPLSTMVNIIITLPRIFIGPEGGSRSKATHSPPLDKAPPSLAERQKPLILKSMRNTMPPVRPCVGGMPWASLLRTTANKSIGMFAIPFLLECTVYSLWWHIVIVL
jgi:hypothetical protein